MSKLYHYNDHDEVVLNDYDNMLFITFSMSDDKALFNNLRNCFGDTFILVYCSCGDNLIWIDELNFDNNNGEQIEHNCMTRIFSILHKNDDFDAFFQFLNKEDMLLAKILLN